ncbi:inovirus-type Gp2 protein [Burkholderia cenocepacia]|uniref:inovirus-type Gp2 protein n=1 Tax=Burkholderia cenocepacia TaxID=95486 RepID=UPI00264DF4D6|nr:inovirus-type Gp2 protein [Burkholderia cenocepacia]MDN7642366.1 inovirus-type Gp2 protein [Burkholderia cenocepacia]
MTKLIERRSDAEIAELLLNAATYSAKDRWAEGHRDAVGTVSREVSRIAKCVKDVIDSQRPLFSIKRVESALPWFSESVEVVPNEVGQAFLDCLNIELESMFGEHPIVRQHPYVDLFWKNLYRDEQSDATQGVYTVFDLRNRIGCLPILNDDERRAVVAGLNNIVTRIREEGRVDVFRKQLKRYWRPAAENYRSLIALIRAIQAQYHHLLIIRLDLSYMRAHRASISYNEVRRHRIAFRRYVKRCKRLKRAYLGDALKLEYGVDMGLHYHALVFVNGDKLHGDVDLARALGEQWKTNITAGRGNYFNCNSQSYGKLRGIGSVRYHDEQTRHNLETRVAAYVTKPDFYIRSVKDDGDHTFWTSPPPKNEPIRRGRKRGKIDAQAAWRSMSLSSKRR